MSDKPDWEAIKSEYESSTITFKDLATKHGVPVTTLYYRSRKWSRNSNSEIPNETHSNSEREPSNFRYGLPSVASAVDGAKLGIEALVEYLQTHAKGLDLAEHVKAATALYQYNRIIINAVSVEDEEEDDTDLITVDTRELTAEQLTKLKAFALDMKESEQVG